MTMKTAAQGTQDKTGAPQGAAPAGTGAPAAGPVDMPFGTRGISLEALGYQNHPKAAQPPATDQGGQPAGKAPENAAGETDYGEKREPETEIPEEKAPPEENEPPQEVMAANGRKYKVVELVKAFDESSREGIRLAQVVKTKDFALNDVSEQLAEANKTILSMQGYIGAGAYPQAKTKEEIEAMDEEQKQNYYADKREWTKKVDEFKRKMQTAKEETEKAAAELKTAQERTMVKMESDQSAFPGFKELKPDISKVMENTPALARLPEGPFIAYYVCMGDAYVTFLANARNRTDESRRRAADEAAAAAAAAGGTSAPAAAGGAGGKKEPAKDDPIQRSMAAYEQRRKVF